MQPLTASLFHAAEFCGTVDGWQPIGPARTATDAARLVALVSRIRPHRLVKVRPVG